MRIRPRQQLLDLWRSMLAACYHEGTWEWGGCDGANSISDAQQLLCLLYPATEIGAFALDSPDDMAADVSSALESLGPPLQIGAVTVGVLEDYLTRYTGPEENRSLPPAATCVPPTTALSSTLSSGSWIGRGNCSTPVPPPRSVWPALP